MNNNRIRWRKKYYLRFPCNVPCYIIKKKIARLKFLTIVLKHSMNMFKKVCFKRLNTSSDKTYVLPGKQKQNYLKRNGKDKREKETNS